LRIAIFYLVGKEHGYGHKVRCEALAEHLIDAGHKVNIISNSDSLTKDIGQRVFRVDGQLHNVKFSIREMVKDIDIVIVDTAEVIPELNEFIKSLGLKLVLLNGIGHELESEYADLVWIQDSPSTVILRKSVLELPVDHLALDHWMVFGGASDEMGLLRVFDAVCDEDADLLFTKLTPLSKIDFIPAENHRLVCVDDDDILDYMSGASRACVHMGMTAWEMAHLGVQAYVISKGKSHLRFANNLMELGLCMSYNGDIHDERFVEFLNSRYNCDDVLHKFDGHKNIMEALETI